MQETKTTRRQEEIRIVLVNDKRIHIPLAVRMPRDRKKKTERVEKKRDSVYEIKRSTIMPSVYPVPEQQMHQQAAIILFYFCIWGADQWVFVADWIYIPLFKTSKKNDQIPKTWKKIFLLNKNRWFASGPKV